MSLNSPGGDDDDGARPAPKRNHRLCLSDSLWPTFKVSTHTQREAQPVPVSLAARVSSQRRVCAGIAAKVLCWWQKEKCNDLEESASIGEARDCDATEWSAQLFTGFQVNEPPAQIEDLPRVTIEERNRLCRGCNGVPLDAMSRATVAVVAVVVVVVDAAYLRALAAAGASVAAARTHTRGQRGSASLRISSPRARANDKYSNACPSARPWFSRACELPFAAHLQCSLCGNFGFDGAEKRSRPRIRGHFFPVHSCRRRLSGSSE